jgi:hypothetical protein
MMKEEFEKRIGLVITDDEYVSVRFAFEDFEKTRGNTDEDEFVKTWLEGGIQHLFDRRLREISILKGIIASFPEDLHKQKEHIVKKYEERYRRLEEWTKNRERVITEYIREVKALKEKLAAIGAAAMEAAA